jgi:hypothetical protein
MGKRARELWTENNIFPGGILAMSINRHLTSILISILLILCTLTYFSIGCASGSLDSGTCWNGGSSGSSPWSVLDGRNGSPSASYADVNYCVNVVASAEDVVNVPSGNATWNSTLFISRAVQLIGAGVGKTVINGSASPYINYDPSSDNWSDNYFFKVSGFTFDMGGSGQGITINAGCATTAQTKIRIDHNRFYNSPSAAGGIENFGARGVIDNNVFDTLAYPLRVGWGDEGCPGYSATGEFTWDTWGEYKYGVGNDAIYVEDNTFTDMADGWTDGDQGGMYVFRYNDAVSGLNDVYPLLDMHGADGDLWGTRGGEVYGNNVNGNQGFFISQRGGRAAVHHNNVNASSGWIINLYNNDGCPPLGEERQKINSSYHFLNRHQLTGSLFGTGTPVDDCGDVVVENKTFWRNSIDNIAPSTTSTMTVGIGCGTLAQMNAVTTCTGGVGFWVTDQSCTSLSGMVGVSPSTPIDGTLYVCGDSNNWINFYAPFTYPHPLRSGPGAD